MNVLISDIFLKKEGKKERKGVLVFLLLEKKMFADVAMTMFFVFFLICSSKFSPRR